MEYAKKTVILKGDHQGIFTMQRSGATKYSLSWTSEPATGDIFVFDEDNFYRLPAKSGVLPIDITRVCAIAVGENFASKGQLRPFNWAKARGMVAAQKKKNRDTIEKNAISNADEPRPFTTGGTEAIQDANKTAKAQPIAESGNAADVKSEAQKGKEDKEAAAGSAQTKNNSAEMTREPEPLEEKEEILNIEEEMVKEPQAGDSPDVSEEDLSQEQVLSQEKPAKEADETEIPVEQPLGKEPIPPAEDEASKKNDRTAGAAQKENQPNAQKAEGFAQKRANPLDQCPMTALPVDVCPFMRDFPESQWKRHEFPSARGKWHYLTGELYQDGKPYATALALPGSPNVRPGGNGFNTYRIAGDGRGYWIRITKI